MAKVKMEFPVAFEDGTIEDVMARFERECPDVEWRILNEWGCQGGWPDIEFVFDDGKLNEVLMAIGCGADIDYWLEEVELVPVSE